MQGTLKITLEVLNQTDNPKQLIQTLIGRQCKIDPPEKNKIRPYMKKFDYESNELVVKFDTSILMQYRTMLRTKTAEAWQANLESKGWEVDLAYLHKHCL